MNKIYRIATFVVLLSPLRIFAQENSEKMNWFYKHPVDFAFGSASVGMPFTNFFRSPFYPMASAGTEFYYKQKDSFDFFQSARINYYNANYSTSAIVLNSETGFRYIFDFGLFADIGLGIGYTHLFRPGAVYVQDNKGEYEQATDWGTPRVQVDYNLSAGFDFRKKSIFHLSMYIRYGNFVDVLYAPDLPVLPHNFIQLGTRYYFTQK